MRKKIIIKNKYGIRVKMDRNEAIKKLYTPYANEFPDYSETFRTIMEKYKNQPLVPYVMTEKDKEILAEDPTYIDLLPRYVVKGYDSAVGDTYEKKARSEFWERFQKGDLEIVNFINDTNYEYKAEIKYIE